MRLDISVRQVAAEALFWVADPPQTAGDFAGPPSKGDDWLTVSTIHSAKGCERDVTYVIHVSKGTSGQI